MNKLIEIREDIRLARLYDTHRWLFRLLDICAGMLKFGVVALFGAGIWYLTSGYEMFASPSAGNVEAVVESAVDNNSELSNERIAMLREFASRNRSNPTDDVNDSAIEIGRQVISTEADEGTSVALLPVQPDVLAVPVANEPELTELASAQQGTDDVQAGEATQTPLEIGASTVFAELQKKLNASKVTGADGLLLDDTLPGPVVASARPGPAGVSPFAKDPLQLGLVVASSASPAVTAPLVVAAKEPAPTPVADRQWMLKQNPALAVIQIASTDNLPFLVRFEKRLPQNQPTAIFEMLIGKRPEHVLTYGLFDDVAEATAELNKLPQSVRRYGAYVRVVKPVQRQVKALDTVAIARKG